MIRRLCLGLLILAGMALASCGGGGGGGSGSVPAEGYNQGHLTGTWSYDCVAQDGSGAFNGEITISDGALITSYTNSICPGLNMADGYLRVLSVSGYVKGRNYNWCGNGSELVKFSMDFMNTRMISGIIDYHYGSASAYKRYNITMNR